MELKIKIAEDFSVTPGARHPEEGEYSGQEFRETVLLPKLKEAIRNGERLVIDLDGTAGYGTSFLEEAFGGLIREEHISYDDIKKTLDFISDEDPEYIDEIWAYIEAAHEQEGN